MGRNVNAKTERVNRSQSVISYIIFSDEISQFFIWVLTPNSAAVQNPKCQQMTQV